ncbi:hypothetical protein CYMTET_29877 [Cymbomonas tetramitiformis]|uniref:Uncharacterized protein n=1 Tax=Cymbomonas tetramitiformis TaxID=36881 RepID=A0AAE0FK68_9CHLO|nr:hypothetical protein CYMTET_29877 [Cymbomonas tetramitiformis]
MLRYNKRTILDSKYSYIGNIVIKAPLKQWWDTSPTHIHKYHVQKTRLHCTRIVDQLRVAIAGEQPLLSVWRIAYNNAPQTLAGYTGIACAATTVLTVGCMLMAALLAVAMTLLFLAGTAAWLLLGASALLFSAVSFILSVSAVVTAAATSWLLCLKMTYLLAVLLSRYLTQKVESGKQEESSAAARSDSGKQTLPSSPKK